MEGMTMSKAIPYKFYSHPETGGTFSVYTSWKPEGCLLITKGWTVTHPDGTEGLGRKAFETEAEAQAWCDANPNFPGMNQH
jgi:hypothetical protein